MTKLIILVLIFILSLSIVEAGYKIENKGSDLFNFEDTIKLLDDYENKQKDNKCLKDKDKYKEDKEKEKEKTYTKVYSSSYMKETNKCLEVNSIWGLYLIKQNN